MKNRFCVKCGTQLPENYKYKKCEGCRNKKIGKIKKIAKRGKNITIAFAGVAIPVVIGVIKKGKK